MSSAFVGRNPSAQEIERLRLILSSYQDGTGMLSVSNGRTLPGWRDFERAVALAFNGIGPENKAIFDVLLTDEVQPNAKYGLSCKMRKELERISRDGRVTIEMSNSSGQFWDQLALKAIFTTNYKEKPNEVGETVVNLVRQWHQSAALGQQSRLDLSRSSYLVLSWSNKEQYQLHQFSLTLPNPEELNWYFPMKKIAGTETLGRHLNGDDADGRVFEWYGESGGQLKYYPKADSALWQSEIFYLEPLPDSEHGILAKTATYFPELWQKL
ncbi:MAG: hypothetical protein ACRYFS_00995 [Janthinobacterium lividum]